MSHATPPEREQAITTAQDLTKALDGVRGELQKVRKSSKISRLIAAVAIAAALLAGWNTVRVSRVADQAAAASSSAHQNQVSSITACRMSNITRGEETQLWAHLASVSSPPPHLSARQLAANKAKVAAFLAYTRRVFAPRQCARLYGGK